MINRIILYILSMGLVLNSCQDPEISLVKAQANYDSGNYTQAIDILKELKYSPNGDVKLQAQILLAKCFFVTEDYENVIKVITSMDSVNVEMYVLLANAQKEEGSYSEAIKSFQYVLDYDYDNYELLNQVGLCYKALGQLEKALEYYNLSLKSNPDFCLAWNSKGVLYETVKKYEDAIICYNKSISFCDSVGEFYFNRGVSYMYLDNSLIALSDFKNAIKYSKEGTLDLYRQNLAFAYYKLDSIERSCEILSSLQNEEAQAYYLELCDGSKKDVKI